MIAVFFVPLAIIAFYEATFDSNKHTWMKNWLRGDDEGEADSPRNRDPEVDDPECEGLQISKVPFEELIKVFPNTQEVGFRMAFHVCVPGYDQCHSSQVRLRFWGRSGG